MALVKIDELTTEQIASICDHTFLKTKADFLKEGTGRRKAGSLRRQALDDFLVGTAKMDVVPYALCVYPNDVGASRRFLDKNGLGQVKIASVVGFPVGDDYTTDEKIEQVRAAMGMGANEIDMVLNYGVLKEGQYRLVAEDISAVLGETHENGGILKVIFENCALNSDPWLIGLACEICESVGVDFIKTSTGKGNYGATVEDLKIMRGHFDEGVKMAGGVKPTNVKELLYAVSGRTDDYINLDPRKIRIGESSLLTGLGDY